MKKQQQIEKMKNKETQNNVFDILNKFEFFQGQRAGRELWSNKPKEVQDKDITDFIKDINYIRSYLQDSVVLSREEYERLKRVENEKDRLYEIKLDLENQLIEKGWTDYEGADEIEKRVSKETAEKILKDFKLWAREYQNKDTVIDDNDERPMTNNEKLNYLYTYLCDKYKVEIKE